MISKMLVSWEMRKIMAGLFQLRMEMCMLSANGDQAINKEQAEVVKLIFDLYLGGESILGIVKELKESSIKSPTGKENWPEDLLKKSQFMMLN